MTKTRRAPGAFHPHWTLVCSSLQLIPNSPEQLLKEIFLGKEDHVGFSELYKEYLLPINEYTELCSHEKSLNENWGPPPGQFNIDAQNTLVRGRRFGIVFIVVQQCFVCDGNPMRLLFSKCASPHHGFAAYFTYTKKVFQTDTISSLGTHSSFNFLPGEQISMSCSCYPYKRIGSTPSIYHYAAKNSAESTIAKRRS